MIPDQDKLLRSAIAAQKAGDLKNCEALYRELLRMNPDHRAANNNLAMLLFATGRADEAAAIFKKISGLFPDDRYVLVNLASCHARQKQFELALDSFRQAIATSPELELVWYNYANCLKDMGQHADAVIAYDRALLLDSNDAKAWTNRGISLGQLRRYKEALHSHERACALNPRYAEARVNLALTLLALRRREEALTAVDGALALRPDMAGAWAARARASKALHRYRDAVKEYERAVALAPDEADILEGFGELLLLLNDPNASSVLLRLQTLVPQRDYVPGQLLLAQMRTCDWTSLHDATLRPMREGIAAGRKLASPFALLGISDSPEDQLAAARTHVAGMHFTSATPPCAADRSGSKLRIAYLSGDLSEHAVTHLMHGVFASHDKSRFETFAVSYRERPDSSEQTHLKSQFDHWLNVEDESDAKAAERIRSLKIDIAVDLAGHAGGARPGLLARRIAPVQVNYLGYPGTMGAEFIDYILADRYVIPPSEARHYAEKVFYLPDSFQANDSNRVMPDDRLSRLDIGLPEDAFVFCCLNGSFKITPDVFAIWMRLLKECEGSVLWLLGENPVVRENLCKAATDRGVDAKRLVFSQRRNYLEYVAAYRLADLFLDTYPFNAGTTASDALWAGLPVLTCSGRTFASRMAGSLLHAVGLPELVTDSLDQYAKKALHLAHERSSLFALRQRLASNRSTAPLFDSARFTRNLETAYLQMHDHARSGDVR